MKSALAVTKIIGIDSVMLLSNFLINPVISLHATKVRIMTSTQVFSNAMLSRSLLLIRSIRQTVGKSISGPRPRIQRSKRPLTHFSPIWLWQHACWYFRGASLSINENSYRSIGSTDGCKTTNNNVGYFLR
jgi:hypothetical protein